MRIPRARSFVLAFSVVVAVAFPIAPAAVAENPPPPESSGNNANQSQALADGCQRDPAALIAQQTPEWAYVYNTPPDQPPPPPQWVSGVIDSYNHAFQPVHTSGADFAFGHDTYDFNVNIVPDPQYTFLMAGHPATSNKSATGNYPGNGEETARLHTEWEDLTVPHFAWPEPGDRITEKGSWVWDCGHWGTPTNIFSPDYDLPQVGQPCPGPVLPDPSQCTVTGERSEFHPYRAMFVQRQKTPGVYEPNGVVLGDNPNSPSAENEGDVFVSTDKTEAGKVADCAHKHRPPQQTVAYPPSYTACVNGVEPNWQDVSGHYEFLLPAPPKPTPDARLIFRAERQPQSTQNAPAPTLTPAGNAVRITFDLASAQNVRLVMGYRIFVGWDTVLPSQVPTHLKVTFDKLEIHRAMDPGCSRDAPAPNCKAQSTRINQATTAPGDYNIYWDANGIWGQWPSVPPGQPPGELLPNDGDSYNGTQSVDLYVPPGKGWRLFVHGRECDINGVDPAHPLLDCPTNEELADNNDIPGLIEDVYASAQASLGTHRSHGRTDHLDPTSTCPDNVGGVNPNPEGCYSFTYTVTKVNDEASRTRLPDLFVSKTDSPDPVTKGQPLTYTVTAKNNGPATAGAVSLTDTLPGSVTFNSVTTSRGSCSHLSGTVTCGLGQLGSGETATVTIKVTPQEPGTITNRASIRSANEPDANEADNTTTESTTVDSTANLSVKTVDSPDPVAVGGKLAYTVRVTNLGPQKASAVTLLDALSKSVRFRSIAWSQGTCSRSGSRIACNLGDLADGATATVKIVVNPTARGLIPNTARVFAESPEDPNTANNTSRITTRVR